jgi:RNA polymerase sigma-70 factor, ECF subfamily
MNGATLLSVQTDQRAMPPDVNLVSEAQAGSRETFRELYALYSRRLYRTIVAITKNHQDAEDALQDTFLRAHLALGRFEGRSTIYSWLTRIAVNSALLILRKQRARPEVFFDPQPDAQGKNLTFEVKDHAPNPEELYDLHQRRVVLLRAIRNLDTGLREPIRMQIGQEASLKEIGRKLNLSEAAVKTRLHRARHLLTAANHLNRLEHSSKHISWAATR